MLSDTKIDLDLSEEIDQQDTSEQAGPGMSLPVPLNLSQPLVKEWFAKKRANIRPVGTFFNTANFQVCFYFSFSVNDVIKKQPQVYNAV